MMCSVAWWCLISAQCLALASAVLVASAADDEVPVRAPPYWPKYGGSRRVDLLDGIWEFGQLPLSSQFDSMDPNLDPSNFEFPLYQPVPSTIDVAPFGKMGYRGVSFFRTHYDRHDLSLAPASILFQACSFYCRVWVNAQEIGDHLAGGYVAFWLNIPLQRKHHDGNEIVVLVDNRFNETTAPLHTGGDFWHYSGIMRSVEWHSLPPNSEKNPLPRRLDIIPKSLSTVHVTLYLTTSTSCEDPLEIGIIFDQDDNDGGAGSHGKSLGSSAAQSTIKMRAVADSRGVVDLGILNVPNPRVWSTIDPQLHTLKIGVNGGWVQERFGLRIIGLDRASNRFTLNGQILKLVGWNHHTQWPETGASPTDEELDADIQLLLRGGANYVRGAHYPQDQRWLDRLDENGFVMWSETLGPGVKTRHVKDPYFMKHQLIQINEMIDNAINHASIAIWGFFNEGAGQDPEACTGYYSCAETIQNRDNSRFITYASQQGMEDKCWGAVSLISFNKYPGWYEPDLSPSQYWNDAANAVKTGLLPGTDGKPFIMSETGAGGIYEWSKNQTATKWTCAYQTKIIAEDVKTAIENDDISGISLWHFFDFKTDDPTENNTQCEYVPDVYPPICAYIDTDSPRPGGANHKGVLDWWRREKESYAVVASLYNETKTIRQLPSPPKQAAVKPFLRN